MNIVFFVVIVVMSLVATTYIQFVAYNYNDMLAGICASLLFWAIIAFAISALL